MPIEIEVSNLEEVDESLRDEYVPKPDGRDGYVLKGAVDSFKELRSALDKERNDSRGFKEQLREYKSLGDSVQLAGLKEKFDQTKAQLSAQERRTAASEAIAKHQGNPALLLREVESHLDVAELEDGTIHAYVKDVDGNPLLNDEGEVMAVDEFVATLREEPDFQAAFRGSGHSGGGTPNDGDGGVGSISSLLTAPARVDLGLGYSKPRCAMTPKERVELHKRALANSGGNVHAAMDEILSIPLK